MAEKERSVVNAMGLAVLRPSNVELDRHRKSSTKGETDTSRRGRKIFEKDRRSTAESRYADAL